MSVAGVTQQRKSKWLLVCNEFQFKECHWRLFLKMQLSTLVQVNFGSGNSLAPDRHQAITWTNDHQCTHVYMSRPVSMSYMKLCSPVACYITVFQKTWFKNIHNQIILQGIRAKNSTWVHISTDLIGCVNKCECQLANYVVTKINHRKTKTKPYLSARSAQAVTQGIFALQ